MKDAKLWTPETPNLYEATLELKDEAGKVIDSVETYFGLRTISRGRYGDEPFERILLNGKPIYLRAALDQSFNPKGLYTAPDDDFLKRDMIIAKTMGLNGLRIHIKPDEPRRLYWADHLGILILEDMPNTWRQNAAGAPGLGADDARSRRPRSQPPGDHRLGRLQRDLGPGQARRLQEGPRHPGLGGEMVELIRELDGHERLVEDNSPCNYDHIAENDLNSWHFYIDDHEKARRHIEDVVAQTKPGSGFNYCPGRGPDKPSA